MRGFAAVERALVLRALLAAARGLAARLEPAFLARPVDALAAVERVEVRELAERVPVDLRAVDFRAADLRAVDFRAVDLRAVPRELDAAVVPPVALPPLPDITRCAASATASAMSAPNLDALDMTLVAACDAVSAASRPASRIFRRAAGLAAIAAAAAVKPAASISLLIAAFAILSTVLAPPRDDDFLDDLEDDLEELFRADFAIVESPSVARKTLNAGNGSLTT